MASHKRFAPSSAKADMTCIGRVAMTEALPESERNGGDSIHARRGTCAHGVGEMCLEAIKADHNTSTTPEDYLDMEVETVVVDKKIVDGVQIYVDYCKPLIISCSEKGFVAIEETYQLANYIESYHDDFDFLYIDGNDMGGTGDFTCGVKGGRLTVVDYKNGVGVVEVEDNPQMLDYGVGALDKYHAKYQFTEVCLVIVQPNAFHIDGEVREWITTPEYVHNHMATKRLPKVEESLEACRIKSKGGDIAHLLNPGDEQCMWCPSKARCAKRGENALSNGGIVMYDDPFEGAALSLPDPQFLTPEQEKLVLDHGEEIINFVTAVRERQHKLAEHGDTPLGWKLVKKNTHRKLRDGMEANLKKRLKLKGLHTNDYLEPPKLKSPNQIEVALRGKGVEIDTVDAIGEEFFYKPDGGNNFVPESAPGKALKPAIETDFEEFFDVADEDLL